MGHAHLVSTLVSDHKAIVGQFALAEKAADALLLRQNILRRGIRYEDAARYLRADYERLSALFMGDLTAIDHKTIKQYLLAIREAIELGIPIE